MEHKLIYDFREHGLYFEKIRHIVIDKEVTLTISDTITLRFDYNTGNLISVEGFMPLIKAIRKHIDMPDFIEQPFCISMKDITYSPGVGIDYFDYFEESKEHFMIDEYNPKLCYDEINKRILIGTQDPDDECIRVNKNLICGFDTNKNLKYLLILIDTIIKEDI